MMTKEIAQKCISLLFDMWDKNEPTAIINQHTKTLIIELIGGEPFLNIETMDFIVSTFLIECINRHHPWLATVRFSVSTNGTLFKDPQVLNFINKYKDFLSLGITLDGPQNVHDLCRIKLDGSGSFNEAFEAWKHFGDKYTKITIAPENLNFINEIADFFIAEKTQYIAMNPAYEPKWTIEQAKEYYQQLKKIADKLLISPIENNIFVKEHFLPISDDLRPWCGGYGEMLAFDPSGIIYPCLRFMPSSLGEIKPIILGDCYKGIYQTEEVQNYLSTMSEINRITENPEKCITCSIISGCGECAAWSYQSNGGILGKRNLNICHMHKARYWANVYYFKKKKISIPIYFSKKEALLYIPEKDYEDLLC